MFGRGYELDSVKYKLNDLIQKIYHNRVEHRKCSDEEDPHYSYDVTYSIFDDIEILRSENEKLKAIVAELVDYVYSKENK